MRDFKYGFFTFWAYATKARFKVSLGFFCGICVWDTITEIIKRVLF